jgi:tetratricopeptide (TPR) repeat protein
VDERTGTAGQHVKRAEEDKISQQLSQVRADRQSRVVLLYGSGGVGKTSIVREMSQVSPDQRTAWLDPIDVDDPECWLLSTLEQKVADKLDPGNDYFAEYRRQLSELPSATYSDISHETIVSYLSRLQKQFAACYDTYVAREDKTVVIVFDTVETIRGTSLLLTLTQWMRALPAATLFILSGRPVDPDGGQAPGGQEDQIVTELRSPYQGMPFTTIEVGRFTRGAASEYIGRSSLSGDLDGDEGEKLALLTRGHPLWLAFMVEYLRTEGIPPEARDNSLADIERLLPYDPSPAGEGAQLHEAFLRRLVAPYQAADFWHEAVKRLAVVRQPVARTVWQRLMEDRGLPDGVTSMASAWRGLLVQPWIRARGNGKFVTLHDAVAEEFAKRLFPLHDPDGSWRHTVWRRALDIYRGLAAQSARRVDSELRQLNAELSSLDPADRSEDDTEAASQERALMDRSMRLDAARRELDQLRALSLYYQFLNDFGEGCRQLLAYFDQAGQQHDSFFQDLLILYLQRFLPHGASSGAFNDVIKVKLDGFRAWLVGERPDYLVALGIMVARYLIDASQAAAALRYLDDLPQEAASVEQVHRMHILRGNACMRIPGQVRNGLRHFEGAIDHAEEQNSANRHQLIAEAYKERGYYYRNTGQWSDAGLSYGHAWQTITRALAEDSPAVDREQMASIQTNWAYVKGLDGSWRDGLELVESAITIRQQSDPAVPADEGMSWSVCGEIHRYARRFSMAWAAYARAEQLLDRNWSRLGFIYQEQAICLYQAAQDGIALVPEPLAEARLRIKKALSICVTNSIRSYPSALNRAGRIFAAFKPDEGLSYLDQGIREAHQLSDGWFWLANLVEYAELCYRQWLDTRLDEFLENIAARAEEIDRVAADLSFPDLAGRWSLLQGHLAVHAYLGGGPADRLSEALSHYESGFVNLARRHVASSGPASLKGEFATFRKIFSELRPEVQRTWLAHLRTAWAEAGDVATVLVARLEELYRPAG